MAKYECVKRVTTDGHKTIHEVGEIITLSDADAKSLIHQGAVVEIPDSPKESVKPEKPKVESGDKT